MDRMNKNNSAAASKFSRRTKEPTCSVPSDGHEFILGQRYRKCTKCGKERIAENRSGESTTTTLSRSMSAILKPESVVQNGQLHRESFMKNQGSRSANSAVCSYQEFEETERSKETKVIVKRHKKIQVDLARKNNISKSTQANIEAEAKSDTKGSSDSGKKGHSFHRKHNKSGRIQKEEEHSQKGVANDRLLYESNQEQATQVKEDAICCRCSLEVYKRRQEFNRELEFMRNDAAAMKLQHKTEIDLFEEQFKKRKAELTSEIDVLLDKRKQTENKVQFKSLEKEADLLQQHSELNKLEEKLLDRIQTINTRQEAVEEAEKQLVEEEGRIERRQSILSTRQLLTQNMSQLINGKTRISEDEEFLQKEPDEKGRAARAQTNWDLVRNAFHDRSTVLQQSLNNYKVQLAAAQNKEMELQKELQEYKQQVKEMEQTALQKDKKIKDLQDRLTTLIKQTLPATTQTRKKSITVDELPTKIEGDNQSGQFVYFSKQRKHSSAISVGESTKGMNSLGYVGMSEPSGKLLRGGVDRFYQNM